jgi:hypothetical protein
MHARSLRLLMTQTAPTPAPLAPCSGSTTLSTHPHSPAKRAGRGTGTLNLSCWRRRGNPPPGDGMQKSGHWHIWATGTKSARISCTKSHEMLPRPPCCLAAVPHRKLPNRVRVRKRRLEERRIPAIPEPWHRGSGGRRDGLRPGDTASLCRPDRRRKCRRAARSASTDRHRLQA